MGERREGFPPRNQVPQGVSAGPTRAQYRRACSQTTMASGETNEAAILKGSAAPRLRPASCEVATQVGLHALRVATAGPSCT